MSKRKLVQKFKTGGRTWRMYEASKESDEILKDAFGYCDSPSGEIVLDESLPADMKRITAAHEMIHAMMGQANHDLVQGLTQRLPDECRSDVEERLASFFSVPLAELLFSLKLVK